MKLLKGLLIALFAIILSGCGTDSEKQTEKEDVQLNCIVYQLTPTDYSYENSSDYVYFIALTSKENIEIEEDPFSTLKDSYIEMEEGFTDNLLKDKIENPKTLYERYIHTNDTMDSIRDRIQNAEISIRVEDKSVKQKVSVIQKLE